MIKLEPDLKLFGALRRASSRWPLYFFASKKMIKVPSKDIETIDVGLHNVEGHDFVALFYNPDFVDSVEKDDLIPYIYHVCSHLMSLHLTRRNHREIKLWDLACDVMVDQSNDLVNEAPDLYPDFFSKKKIAQIPCLQDLDFEEVTTEDIYDILKEDFECTEPRPEDGKQPQGGAGGSGGSGDDSEEEEEDDEDNDDSEDEGDDSGDNEDEEEDGDEDGDNDSNKPPPQNPSEGKDGPDSHLFWHEQRAGASSTLNSQQEASLAQFVEGVIKEFGDQEAGDIPGELKRFINNVLKPQTPWKRYIKSFAQRSVSTKKTKTWKRPSRRYFNGEYSIAPGKKFIRKPKILVVIDNSGSIGVDEYSEFIAHMIHIAFLCEKLDVIGVDVRVNFVHKDLKGTKKGNLPNLEDFGSGGGTKFQPAFDFAKEGDYTGIIYFTDGANSDLNKLNNYGIPVLFALCQNSWTTPVHGFKNINIESTRKTVWGI